MTNGFDDGGSQNIPHSILCFIQFSMNYFVFFSSLFALIFNKMTHNNSLWLSSSLLLLFFWAYDIFSVLSSPPLHTSSIALTLVLSLSLSCTIHFTEQHRAIIDVTTNVIMYTKYTPIALTATLRSQFYRCSCYEEREPQHEFTLDITIHWQFV